MSASATRPHRSAASTAAHLAAVACALVLSLPLAAQVMPQNPTVDQGATLGLSYGTCTAQQAPEDEWGWSVTGPVGASVQGGPPAYYCWFGVFLAPYTPGTYVFTLTRFGGAVGSTSITVNPVVISLSGQSTLYENWTTTDAVTATMTGMGSTFSSDYAMTWSISPINDMVLNPSSASGLNVKRETIKSGITPGSYVVTATSVKEPAVHGQMIVTVVAPQVTVSPSSAVAIPGQTVTFNTTATNTPYQDCFFLTDDPWASVPYEATTFPLVHSAGKPGGQFHIWVDGIWGGSATATLTVVAVTLTPASIVVLPGTARQFLAEVTGSQQAVKWSTTVPGATISSTGLLSVPAGAPLGSYTVTVQTVGNPVSPATAAVTIANSVPVTSVVISPARSVIDSGQQEPLAAVVLGQNDEPNPNQAVSWSVAGPAAASMPANGLFTAPTTPGVYIVTATSQADPTKSGTATVTVGEDLMILPSWADVSPGQSEAFTAQVSGVANPAVTWTVEEGPAGGSITAAGLYTASAAPGVYHVVAVSASGGATVQGIATVLVGATPQISVSVTPSEVEVTAGATQQFTALVEGAADTAVVWSASAGQIDATGLFTAPASYGSVTITATSHADSSVQASATAVVSSAAQGQAFQYDANGNLLSDGTRTFEWDAENRLTAINAGTHRSEFGYDGLGRRVLISEKNNGAVTSGSHFLWIGDQMVEETDATSAPSTSPPPIGGFGSLDCNQLAGWAWDATRPNTPINVDVYDGSAKIATVLASTYRGDLRAAGAGNGDHAFFLPTPAALKTGAAHSVTLEVGSTVVGTRSVTCAAPSFNGFFDSANCGTVSGWAWDANQPNSPINVDVYDGSTLIATVLAANFRQDLLNAGIGNGNHGFSFSTPPSLKTGTTHTLTLKIGGTATVLGAKTLSCPAPSFAGSFGVADCTQLAGWAMDQNQPNSAITVDIYDGTTLLATVLAGIFRQDLLNAGLGNGKHGFSFATPAFYTGSAHALTIQFGGTALAIAPSPRSITCPNETILSRFFPGGMQSGAASYYFSYDHLGSVREVTDAGGNVVSRYDYDPYGRLTINQGTPPRFGFGGSYYHAQSGLSLTPYRAYDPDLGRWESRDPVELPTDGSFYKYADNDPTNLIDPIGDQPRTPANGPPGGWVWFPKGDGSGNGTWRQYGPDGRAKQDHDYGHDHGKGDPHGHDWDWSKDPPRQPDRGEPNPRPMPQDPNQKSCPIGDTPWHFPTLGPLPPWVLPALAVGGAIAFCVLCPECCVGIAVGAAF